MKIQALLRRFGRGAKQFAAASMTAALAACASSGVSTPEPQAAAGAPQTTGSISPAGSPLAKPSSVRVALLLPLTGSPGTAEVAKGLRQAGELALLEYDNPNILLISKDTQGTPDGARRAAEEAIAGGAEVILGPLFAQEVAAAASVARPRNVPIIAFSSDRSVAGSGVYLLSFLAGQDVPRIVEHTTRQGRRNIAALVPAGAYGKVIEQELRRAVEVSGARLATVQSFPPGANGMLGPIKRIKETIAGASATGAPVDTLFISAGQETLPSLAPLIPYNDIDTTSIKIVGTSDWDYPNVGREAILRGGWYAAPDPKGWAEFTQRYAKGYGSGPPRLASLAYDAVSLVVSLSSNAPGQRFTAANLTRGSGFTGVDGLFRLRADGTVQRGLAVLEVREFGPQVIDPAPAGFAVEAPAASANSQTGGVSSGLPRFNFAGASQ